jgi:hypothetical protein
VANARLTPQACREAGISEQTSLPPISTSAGVLLFSRGGNPSNTKQSNYCHFLYLIDSATLMANSRQRSLSQTAAHSSCFSSLRRNSSIIFSTNAGSLLPSQMHEIACVAHTGLLRLIHSNWYLKARSYFWFNARRAARGRSIVEFDDRNRRSSEQQRAVPAPANDELAGAAVNGDVAFEKRRRAWRTPVSCGKLRSSHTELVQPRQTPRSL